MKIYLAARYSRRELMCDVAAQLRRLGHGITSRWLYGSHDLGPDGRSRTAPLDGRARLAQEDMDDVIAADCVITFTEPEGAPSSRGGRHVEFGIALALGKRLVVVGYRENVFHTLPQVEFFESHWDLIRALSPSPVS